MKSIIAVLVLSITTFFFLRGILAAGGIQMPQNTSGEVSITSISSDSANSVLLPGESISFNVAFSELILIEGGVPYIQIAPMGATALCEPTTEPTGMLVCSYVVQQNDSTNGASLEIANFSLGGALVLDSNGNQLNTQNLFSSSTNILQTNNITIASPNTNTDPIPVPETDFTDDIADDTSNNELDTNTLSNFALVGVILILVFFTYLVLRSRNNR